MNSQSVGRNKIDATDQVYKRANNLIVLCAKFGSELINEASQAQSSMKSSEDASAVAFFNVFREIGIAWVSMASILTAQTLCPLCDIVRVATKQFANVLQQWEKAQMELVQYEQQLKEKMDKCSEAKKSLKRNAERTSINDLVKHRLKIEEKAKLQLEMTESVSEKSDLVEMAKRIVAKHQVEVEKFPRKINSFVDRELFRAFRASANAIKDMSSAIASISTQYQKNLEHPDAVMSNDGSGIFSFFREKTAEENENDDEGLKWQELDGNEKEKEAKVEKKLPNLKDKEKEKTGVLKDWREVAAPKTKIKDAKWRELPSVDLLDIEGGLERPFSVEEVEIKHDPHGTFVSAEERFSIEQNFFGTEFTPETEEELGFVKQAKKDLRNRGYAVCGDSEGIESGLDDQQIMRFVRAHASLSDRYNKTLESLLHTCQWRVENRVCRITKDLRVQEISKLHLTPLIDQQLLQKMRFYIYGVSKRQHPVLYVKCPEADAFNRFKPDRCQTFHIVKMELMQVVKEKMQDVGHYVYKHVVVIDIRNLSKSHIGPSFMTGFQHQMQIDQAHYKESLDTLILIYSGWMLKVLWRAIKPLIDEATLSRIQFITDVTKLQDLIESSQIPPEYGGTGESIPIPGGVCLPSLGFEED